MSDTNFVILAICLAAAVLYLYELYSFYKTSKNIKFNNENFRNFELYLKDSNHKLIVEQHHPKNYNVIHYGEYNVGYDKHRQLSVYPKPAKTPDRHLDMLIDELILIKGSSLSISYQLNFK